MHLLKSINPFAWACFQEPTLDDKISQALESLEFQYFSAIQDLEDISSKLQCIQNKLNALRTYKEAFSSAKTSSEKQTGKPIFLGIIGK
jgi:hypothetical protein